MSEVDEMVDAMIQEGEQAINALPDHARRIAGLLSTHFPAQTLDAVHAAMRPAVKEGPVVNGKVSELNSILREEAAVAAAQFRACEMWLRLKQPSVSDGNNFGVEVQNYVVEQMQAMRAAIETIIVSGRDYHWTRGTGLEKLYSEDKQSTSQMEKKEQDLEDGKPKEKTSTSQTTTTSKTTSNPFADYAEYVVCVDVRQYHLVFDYLTALRNNYLKAHVLFAKNMKKLNDPRGDADGKTANVMSMF